ncbi:hypothetical protein [Bhargavaea massiliensis]|uniref:hypothetical protein n=1 Tax=Bhargavaea massiliensis TaxID=2697500 RepID=UPI001BCEE46D|nr:hypothetical protein [Bhargavaea massiliensis]
MKTVERMRNEFLVFLESEFPKVVMVKPLMKGGKDRTSPKMPGERRWMQVDVNSNSLSIVINYKTGTINEVDLQKVGIPIGLSGDRTAWKIGPNNDNLSLSIFPGQPIEFDQEHFVELLKKLYRGYLALL